VFYANAIKSSAEPALYVESLSTIDDSTDQMNADTSGQPIQDTDGKMTAENSNQPIVTDKQKPYQLLYPNLYCTKSSEEINQVKTIYLTFDDGPSKETVELLKILKDNNVKATFFVIGKADETSKSILKQIADEGHTIGVHSYTHIYKEIYESVEAYLKDFNSMSNLIYEATGLKPSIYRFPGGSVNSYNEGTYRDIIEEMNRRGFTYYDWNVSSVDTNSNNTAKTLYRNVVNQVSNHSRSIVLFHDSSGKRQTVQALDGIIKDLKEQGYTFDSLSNKIKPIIFNK
jgi:peptidoglycan/xylan/chitin deacetylase (PgdA/CDA1 family)